MEINPFLKIKKTIEQKSEEIKHILIDIQKSIIDQRNVVSFLKRKIRALSKDKINIVFVCHRPQVWGALKTVCDSCINDTNFRVTIVAIPNKKQMPELGLGHENYISEGAEEFFKDYPCRVINGYDYKLKKWFNLKKLEPDYLFFQTPYDICRPSEYQSGVVAKYTHLCYIPYAFPIFGRDIEESVYPIDFFSKLRFIFVHSEWRKNWLFSRLKNVAGIRRIEISGYPKFDDLRIYKSRKCNFWKHQGNNRKFRIIWTPRWSVSEGNCHFFDYNERFLRLAAESQDIEISFRPHPQMWLEMIATGELSESEIDLIKKKWQCSPNTSLDETYIYFDKFFSSDLLISDSSTIFGPYILTGNPIIYCYKTDDFNEEGQKLAKGFYLTHCWEEVVDRIIRLKNKEDPLKSVRSEIIRKNFYLPKEGAGFFVKECLKRNFYGETDL